MKYFGTDLITHGHYVWVLQYQRMYKLGINFSDLPFHPEELTRGLEKGSVIYYQGGGFTVIGISGSCLDTRPGTKSIFWIEEILTYDEMKDTIDKIPIARNIIEQMPFEVQWVTPLPQSKE